MIIPNPSVIEKPLSRLFIPEPYRNEYDFIEDHLLKTLRQLRKPSIHQIPSRRLKNRIGYREPGPEARRFPEILLRGVWLEQCGFDRHGYVHVFPFQNILVVCQE